MNLTYTSAYINFPGRPEMPLYPGMDLTEPVALDNKVIFPRNGYWICASIKPYVLPSSPSLSKDPVVQGEIIQPAINLVSADLETIDDLLPKLQELAANGKVIANLYYKKKSEPEESFMVYDYSLPDQLLFKRLLMLKGVDPRIVKQQYAEFPELAGHVGNDMGTEFVEGKTLKEAVRTAWLIYMTSERIKELPE